MVSNLCTKQISICNDSFSLLQQRSYLGAVPGRHAEHELIEHPAQQLAGAIALCSWTKLGHIHQEHVAVLPGFEADIAGLLCAQPDGRGARHSRTVALPDAVHIEAHEQLTALFAGHRVHALSELL